MSKRGSGEVEDNKIWNVHKFMFYYRYRMKIQPSWKGLKTKEIEIRGWWWRRVDNREVKTYEMDRKCNERKILKNKIENLCCFT